MTMEKMLICRVHLGTVHKWCQPRRGFVKTGRGNVQFLSNTLTLFVNGRLQDIACMEKVLRFQSQFQRFLYQNSLKIQTFRKNIVPFPAKNLVEALWAKTQEKCPSSFPPPTRSYAARCCACHYMWQMPVVL